MLSLLFPPLCLYCKEKVEKHELCKECLTQLHLIEPDARCLICFADLEGKSKRCEQCMIKGFRCGAAFDYFGPAAALVRDLKYGGRIGLATSMASYMALQFFRLEWPQPDLIVPVPLSFAHFLTRGYNQSLLLAEELGKILNVPVADPLKRSSETFSQSGLDKEHRLRLSAEAFTWKKQSDIADKTLLLIDDVTTTKTTLSHCAARLQEGFPRRLFALTFCI